MDLDLRTPAANATLAAAESHTDLAAAISHVALASSGAALSIGLQPALNSWSISAVGLNATISATWQPDGTITFKAESLDGYSDPQASATGSSVVALRMTGFVAGTRYRLWWKLDLGGIWPDWDDTLWRPAMTSSGVQCEWKQPGKYDAPIYFES